MVQFSGSIIILRAAVKRPQLFYRSPASVQANIEAVAEHFRKEGLTLPDYLRAAVNRPDLLQQSPATMVANIEKVVAHFREHGLTLNAYLRAAISEHSQILLNRRSHGDGGGGDERKGGSFSL